jgi:hypothetical protein
LALQAAESPKPVLGFGAFLSLGEQKKTGAKFFFGSGQGAGKVSDRKLFDR